MSATGKCKVIRYVHCLAVVLLLAGCSSEQGDEEEKSIIRQKTDEVATEIVDHIRQPIDKAEAVKEIEEARRAQYEEQTQ